MMKTLPTCLEQLKMKIAVINVTRAGEIIAEKLSERLEIDLYAKELVRELGIKEIANKVMKEYKAVVFISSTGIAVRAIAGSITAKDKDPAVIVIDSSGNFVISLLSGHLGGANELTEKIARILGSTAVITTATDNLGIVAPDMIAKNNDLVIDSLKDAKEIAALLVDNKKVGFVDLKGSIPVPKGYTTELEDIDGLVYVTNRLQNYSSSYSLKYEKIVKYKELNRPKEQYGVTKKPDLKLIRKDIVLGIGCRKNFDADKMRENIIGLLKVKNLDERAVKVIATVEVKKNEEAILKLAEYFDCELKIFTIEEIKKIHRKYRGSDFVEKTIGVRAVAEPCVELLGARLITDKIKIDGMTACIGEIY